MQKTKFDQKLQSFFIRGRDRLEALEMSQQEARELRDHAVDLLRRGYQAYGAAVDKALAEGEEAQRAAEDAAAAESECEQYYARLHAKLTSHYYDLVADDPDEAELFNDRMRRAFSHAPSAFESLGADRTLSAFEPAVEFAAAKLGANNPLVREARGAHAALEGARSTADAEQGESVEAMQELYAARADAKRHYNAARRIASAALILEQTEKSIGQIMAPLSDIYKSRDSSADREDASSEQDEPVAGE